LDNYEHKKLFQTIVKLEEVPGDSHAFSEWLKAEDHLNFLRKNVQSEEFVIYAAGKYFFAHSVVVSNSKLSPVDQDDLMKWNFNPYSSIASYVTGGGSDKVWIERGLSGTGTKTLEHSMQLIFARTFDGWTGPGRCYYELHQEYEQLSGIHWRPEQQAYCRFNDQGDIESVVSATTHESTKNEVGLVSFKWETLEEYLVATDASIVRMFDFTLYRPSGFSGWSDDLPQQFYESTDFFYHRKVMPGYAAYTRGVQIIRPRRPDKTVFTAITDGWFGKKKREYAEFIAYDWRNTKISKISTNPSATANYFNANDNNLPFELSPAFFRPEVLLKYKADRDKYTVSERDVSCRAAWHLKGIDVNEAGQVHAYICDLRHLPYTEQLHWLSFNEPPKAGISQRAIINDFKGEWVTFREPLQEVLSIVRQWHDGKVLWWKLRDKKLIERVNTPLSASRDEWAEAFMDLAKLVLEGFETKTIRGILDAEQLSYQSDERTIALLEKLLNKANHDGEQRKLIGLRTVQSLRSKAKGHVGGNEAEQLAQDALMQHETYSNHFRHVCTQVVDELKIIEQLF
jgi:hypothetical protein